MTRDAADGAGALEKALDVLEVVGANPTGLSQVELADKLALPRSTAYRLLSTLVTRGLLRRDPTQKVYRLGFRCFEMARQAYAMPDLAAAAATELRTLRDLTGETSYLATLDGLEVISLERFDGAHSQRSAAALGQRKPLHCTSQGKAILSALPVEARDALVRDITLKPLTPHTITDRRRLHAELKMIAARGWSMDDEEIVLGVRCVGAPVVDAEGKVRGAISIAGPAWRMTRQRAELLGPEVAEAARRIGAELKMTATPIGDSGIEAVAGTWAFDGAFPRWSTTTERLYWADALAPALHVTQGGVDQLFLELEHPVTGLVLHRGDLIVIHETTTLRVTSEGSQSPLTAWPVGKLLALCGTRDGRLWGAFSAGGTGSAIGEVRPGGHFDAKWTTEEHVQALAWNAREDQLYATAPGSGSLLLLRPGEGSARRLATLPKGSGQVSGVAVDSDGGVWTALRDGWSAVRITADGALDRVIGLPVPCPTDVALVGQQLYLTTARHSVPLDALDNAPLSGRLLVTQV